MHLSGARLDDRLKVVLYATSAAGAADAAMRALRETLDQALRHGFTPAEVVQTQRTWAEQRKASLGNEGAYVDVLVDSLQDGRDHAWLARYDDAFARVTASQATEALRKYLGRAPIVWAIGRGR
jgi:zinc protease